MWHLSHLKIEGKVTWIVVDVENLLQVDAYYVLENVSIFLKNKLFFVMIKKNLQYKLIASFQFDSFYVFILCF